MNENITEHGHTNNNENYNLGQKWATESIKRQTKKLSISVN